MNQTLSAAVQLVTPPFIWNAYQRLRRRGVLAPWREFGQMATCSSAAPLVSGRFAELCEKYERLDPFRPGKLVRYRNYNVCYFAKLCRNVPGDFVCAGVSWGVTPRIVFDYVDFPSLGKTLHLIDPFEGIVSNTDSRTSASFNRDPEYIRRQYPAGGPVIIHRERIPIPLPGPFAFVFTDTGNPAADAAALPHFFTQLSAEGVFISEQYANNTPHYDPVLKQLGVTPLWLPSGQGVIFKR